MISNVLLPCSLVFASYLKYTWIDKWSQPFFEGAQLGRGSRQAGESLANMAISFYNSFTTPVVSILYLYEYMSTTVYLNSVLFISGGFFVIDTVYLLRLILQEGINTTANYQMLLHHVMVMASVCLGFNVSEYNVPYIAIAYLTETSTIFLNLCKYEYTFGRENGLRYKLSAICLLLTFLVFRIVMFALYIVKAVWSLHYYPIPPYLAFMYLNTFWFSKLLTRYKS